MKTILITGATDGIGLLTAKALVSKGHNVLLHGRSKAKLDAALEAIEQATSGQIVKGYLADLSDLNEVKELAQNIKANHQAIDVLINNAGVFKLPNPVTANGFDVRFVVNTIAPYLLTKLLAPMLGKDSRVVNLSSAAQAPVSLEALAGNVAMSDNEAYAQSKLAITMWTKYLASIDDKVMYVAVNPASFLGSKMVKDAYGVAGNDMQIGVDILCRAALSDEFANASGKYFDNDNQYFAEPHVAGRDMMRCQDLVEAIERILAS